MDTSNRTGSNGSVLELRRSLRPSRSLVLTVGAFLCVLGIISYRAMNLVNVPGHPDSVHWAMQDFRDAIYYPVVAFLQGNNPYNTAVYLHTYPVGQRFSPYSPLTLVVHLPFGLLPFQVAELAYYLLTVVLVVALAALTLRICDLARTPAAIFGLAAVILATRPGHWNLLLGQSTVQLVIGAYLALYYAQERPWVAGFGLALTTIKPTFGLPLAVLMIANRNFRATLIGMAVAAVPSLLATACLVHDAGGVVPLLTSLRESYVGFTHDLSVNPVASPARIDVVAVVSRLLGHPLGAIGQAVIGTSIIGLGALAVRRLASLAHDGNARRLSMSLACLVILSCTYQQGYDLLLLVLPLVALAAGRWAPGKDRFGSRRWLLLIILTLPMVNYMTAFSVLDRLKLAEVWWQVITSADGVALLIAWVIYEIMALRRRQDPAPAGPLVPTPAIGR